jgi:hypothetical protein
MHMPLDKNMNMDMDMDMDMDSTDMPLDTNMSLMLPPSATKAFLLFKLFANCEQFK